MPSTPWDQKEREPEQASSKQRVNTRPNVDSVVTTHLGLLLLLLLGLLLSLRLGNGRRPLCKTGLCGLVPPCLDGGKVGTDDTTLVLHSLARPLLGNLLRNTLLVHATVDLSPGDLARVFALEEERLILGGGEAEDLIPQVG